MGFYAGEVFGPNELEELLARVNKDEQVGDVSVMSSSKRGGGVKAEPNVSSVLLSSRAVELIVF